MLYRFVRFYFHIPLFLRLLLTVLTIMTVFGFLMYWAEPNEFSTWFDGVWFAFITGATVGYGDFVPKTIFGQLLTILLILAGGGLLTFYMVTLSSGAIKREDDYKKGEVTFHGKEHFIIVGWNERTRRLIELIETQYGKQTDLVLIDETLEEDPVNHTNVHFIHGDPTVDDTWDKANITNANKVIVTADQSKIEKEADVHTILVIITVRGLHHELPILGEILTEKQKRNAERAGATEIICTNETTSTLFYHELTGHEYVKAFDYVMALLSQQQFIIDSVNDEWINQPILEISEITKKKRKLLLGFIRDGEIKINPDPNESLQQDDQVITIKKLLE